MYYCYSIKRGLFDNEMQYAKDTNVYIFYDEETDKFYTKEEKELDINGLNIFPRTGALQANKLLNAIIRHKGNCLIKETDYNITLDWPNYIETKRKNIIITGKEILENPNKIVDMFGNNKVFFKTKNKNYSGIIEVLDLTNSSRIINKALETHQNEDFIISDVVDILKDDFGPLEYRCFVVNNKILNVSRVHDYLYHKIDENIIFEIQNYIERLEKTDFPDSYVIDIFEYIDEFGEKNIDILECNPIIASGTFLYNSVFLRDYNLLHTNPEENIPLENKNNKKSKYYGYEVEGNTRTSICYNLPGGFAADCMSIKMFGRVTKGSFLHIDSGGKNVDFSGPITNGIKILESDSLDNNKGFLNEPIVKSENFEDMIKRLNKELLKKDQQ